MNLDMLLLILLRVTVVALIGRLLLAAMKRAAASTRYLVAVTTFASMLAVPLISMAGPQWRLALLPAAQPASADAEKSGKGFEKDGAAGAWGQTPPQYVEISTGTPWRRWLLPLILGVGGAFVARMLFGMIAIRLITRRAREIADDTLVRDFDIAGERLGVGRMVRLLASERVTVPLVWGITRPALLLPAGALQWSSERLRVVFLHELAHLRRGDAITLLLTRAVTALYWFHPLAWSLDRAARRDCEQACDDLVLASGTRASDYANHLLGIARALPPHDPFGAVTLAMSRRSQLEGRLLSILQPDAPRSGVSRRKSLIAAAAAALLVVPIAAVQIVAKPAPEPAKETRQLKKAIEKSIDDLGDIAGDLNLDSSQKSSAVKKHRAIERYESARAESSRTADDWYDVGKELLKTRDLPRAAEAFREAINLDPWAGSAWYNLACAQALAGDRNGALDTLEKALLHNFGGDGEKLLHDSDLDSLHGQQLDELARLADDLALHNDGDDWADAIARYERIARQHPTIARAWFNYGFALCEGGKPGKAVDIFTRVLNSGYRPGTVMYNIGCSYALAGDRQSAISWLMKADAAGFDVGSYAKGDKDLQSVRREPWLAEKIAEAKSKEHDKKKHDD